MAAQEVLSVLWQQQGRGRLRPQRVHEGRDKVFMRKAGRRYANPKVLATFDNLASGRVHAPYIAHLRRGKAPHCAGCGAVLAARQHIEDECPRRAVGHGVDPSPAYVRCMGTASGANQRSDEPRPDGSLASISNDGVELFSTYRRCIARGYMAACLHSPLLARTCGGQGPCTEGIRLLVGVSAGVRPPARAMSDCKRVVTEMKALQAEEPPLWRAHARIKASGRPTRSPHA